MTNPLLPSIIIVICILCYAWYDLDMLIFCISWCIKSQYLFVLFKTSLLAIVHYISKYSEVDPNYERLKIFAFTPVLYIKALTQTCTFYKLNFQVKIKICTCIFFFHKWCFRPKLLKVICVITNKDHVLSVEDIIDPFTFMTFWTLLVPLERFALNRY